MKVIVKKSQSSFIASRSISDNIIIAQEALHTMKTTKSKKGWTTINDDLDKAYDRV